MKQLKVPLLLQEKDSIDCGPTSATMVMNYLGKQVGLEESIKNSDYADDGTNIYNNGLLMLKAGLKTLVITANPTLFTGDDIKRIGSSRPKLVTFLKNKVGKEKVKSKRNILKDALKYLEQGGAVKLAIPTLKDIHAAIDAEKPVQALTYARALGKNQGGFHTVVVTGYKKGKLFINNPWPLSRRRSWEDENKFMYALYSGTTYDYDNGSILIASKK